MRANINFHPRSGKQALAWLKQRIHLHAPRETPRAYIRAAWWRLRGKRVRARSQFAPLLARSPLAYRLWIGTVQRTAHLSEPSPSAPRMVALIYNDCDADTDALARTQASLAADGIPAFAASAPPGAADILEENAECWFMPIKRLNRMGWQSLYEPRARLIHQESVSRGFDRDPKGAVRLAAELAELKRAWRTHEAMDPFHHPQLNRFSEQFVVQL